MTFQKVGHLTIRYKIDLVFREIFVFPWKRVGCAPDMLIILFKTQNTLQLGLAIVLDISPSLKRNSSGKQKTYCSSVIATFPTVFEGIISFIQANICSNVQISREEGRGSSVRQRSVGRSQKLTVGSCCRGLS